MTKSLLPICNLGAPDQKRSGASGVALVVGGAACVWDDLKAALALFLPDVFVVVNEIGATWPLPIHFWCSYHSFNLEAWAGEREENGLSSAWQLWSGPAGFTNDEGSGINRARILGGSSGMLATYVALAHIDKAVLVGIPLDPSMPHFSAARRTTPWVDAAKHHKTWNKAALDFEDRVRSMSGWTRQKFGFPTSDWLHPSQ